MGEQAGTINNLSKLMGAWPEMIDNLPQPVLVMDRDGRIIYANKTTGRASGYSTDELLGNDFDLLLSPDQRAPFRVAVGALLANGVSAVPNRVLMLEIANKAGVKVPVNATVAILRSDDGEAHVLARLDDAYLNLTRQQIARLQLDAATDSQELMQALDIVEDPIVIFDDQWRYLFANQVGWEVLGRDKREVLGHVVWDLLPYLHGSEWKKAAYMAMATGRRGRVVEYYVQSGSWYESHFYPSQTMLVAQMKDITEAKKMKVMNEQLMDTLEQAMSNIPKHGREGRRQQG